MNALYPAKLANLFPRYIAVNTDGKTVCESDRFDFAVLRLPLSGGIIYDRQQLSNVRYY